jgi:hypothetical protein
VIAHRERVVIGEGFVHRTVNASISDIIFDETQDVVQATNTRCRGVGVLSREFGLLCLPSHSSLMSRRDFMRRREQLIYRRRDSATASLEP